MSIRLYIGNLPKEVMERQELQEVFAEEGDSVITKLITDRKTGKCRGFGFVTVKNDEQADQIIEKYNGYQFKESPLKIEKALPRSKNKSDLEKTEDESKPANKSSGKIKKSRREKDKGASKTTSSTPSGNDAVQPDPRWADALAELKQRLAATTNS
ncbi:MAG: RNA-binding protein [Okeania sp. SIO2D1]|uniref:RNA recognition motif domain-containing protein n=1 Tax=Okeania sp. SIO2C9 TaxID=2607791 RepID=UPI0013B9AEFA|nr:RNA-binding protein [Okeania sp. SIO2C9]NEQ74619.1 RNA-binding protein [Okeania sp. SIO2C9]NES71185.1 RNA-binding protein [Okeania sp. SIO2D1]